jgi:hypothetical protein
LTSSATISFFLFTFRGEVSPWLQSAPAKEPVDSSATLSARTPRNAPKAIYALRAKQGNQAC